MVLFFISAVLNDIIIFNTGKILIEFLRNHLPGEKIKLIIFITAISFNPRKIFYPEFTVKLFSWLLPIVFIKNIPL